MGIVYYANPDPTFQPAMRLVSNITNDYPALVTTSFDHEYITGMIVRLYIPEPFGMVQADQLHGAIIIIDPTSFTIDIDTSLFDAFIPNTPLHSRFSKIPMVVPIGQVNAMLEASVRNVL